MQIRHWLSVVGLFTILSSIAYANGWAICDAVGRACGGSSAETQSLDGSKDNSDPINLSTGDFQHQQTDLKIPGRGLDFEISRFYRSFGGLQTRDLAESGFPPAAIQSDGFLDDLEDANPLGQNWDFNYNMRVSVGAIRFTVGVNPLNGSNIVFVPGNYTEIGDFTEAPPPELCPYGDINVFTGKGRIDTFNRDYPETAENVVSPANPALYSNELYQWQVVYRSGYRPIRIIDDNMVTFEFYPGYDITVVPGGVQFAQAPYAGRLKSIVDRNGNQIQFFYETTASGFERLDYAMDTLDNQIDFLYHDSPSSPLIAVGRSLAEREQLIWIIEDHADRAFQYNYSFGSGFPMLASVTLPAIENTSDFPLSADHERFPTGADRKWSYAYDDNPELYYWWKGRMLTTITSPNGDIVLQNEYMLPGAAAHDFGQQYTRNDARVIRQQYGNAAYNYVVTTIGGALNVGAAGSTSDDYYVWVNDRRGAITRFKYAGSTSSTPGARHRQLLEKTEFEGFAPNADQSMFATQSGSTYSWFAFNPLTDQASPTTGPTMPDGSTKTYTQTLTANSNWKFNHYVRPNGDTVNITYDDTSSDPRRWGTVLDRTITSQDTLESISEYWQYDFNLGGAGGCGCSVQGFETAYRDGKGYVTFKVYDESINAVTGMARANLLAVYEDLPPGAGMNPSESYAANNAASIDRYTYNQWGQVETHTRPSKKILDSMGAETEYVQVDQYEYYGSGNANYGRLHKMHVDVNGLDLITTYEYDAIGNVVKVTKPSEKDELGNVIQTGDIDVFLYNQDSKLVQEQHFESTGTILYDQVDYYYDANGNLVSQEVMNIDGDLNIAANASITSIFEYDLHNYLLTASREAGDYLGSYLDFETLGDAAGRFDAPDTDDAFVTQKWEYDGANNLVKFSDGEAVNGVASNQVNNVITHEYDARDLRIKTTQGAGSTTPLVTAYEYDINERLQFKLVNPAVPTEAQITEVVYDAFDRIVERIDPMGNQYLYKYDNNHNPIELRVCGPVGLDIATGSDSQYLLAIVSRSYGKLDLMESESIRMFNYDYTIGSESGPICEDDLSTLLTQQTTNYSYNKDSSIYEIHAPSGDSLVNDVTTIHYDTASRFASKMDGAGNITQYEYDADSNVSKVIQSEISSTGSTTEEFEVEYEYDALNRQIAMIDGVGNRTKTWFDSRSNMVEVKDALNSISTYTYDSLNRLTDTSLGNGLVTTEKMYDNSSRLISEMDANGNTTVYEYDDLNRVTKVTMPDGSYYHSQYDQLGNVEVYTDARGVVVTQLFDKNNRLYQRNITGTTVPGATEEHFSYDGLGRMRTASNEFAEVTREYDSRMNVIREIQNIDAANGFPTTSDQVVAYEFDTANNNSKIVYPDNIRSVYRTHDELNRLVGIFNDATFLDPISEFGYIGTRLKDRTHGNGTQTEYGYNGIGDGSGNAVGDFGFGRIATISTTNTVSTNVLDAFEFAWDKSQNRIAYKDTGSGMKNRRERTFGYDSANRLTSTDVDYPDPLTDYTAPANNGITTYSLDGVHNRTDVSGYESNGAPLGSYSQSGNQALNNQYTVTPREGGGSWTYVYDENGNMVLKAEYNVSDFNDDYVLNFFDYSAFMTAYDNQDESADLNDDGIWNFFDVSIFLGVYVNGATLDNVHYSYDFRNQLVGIEFKNGSTVSYTVTNTYDPMARRVVEEITEGVNVESKQMVYGGESLWEVLEQIDLSTDDVLLTHVYGLGIDDEVSYRIENQSIPEDIWTHRDDLNSLTSITDDNGDILERYEYGDYGKVSYFNAAGLSIPAPAYNAYHLYTGRSLITGAGLYDYRFRVMDPESGRFVQRDPYWHRDSMNLYTYVMSNPLSSLDPFGLFTLSPPFFDPTDPRNFGRRPGVTLKPNWRSLIKGGAKGFGFSTLLQAAGCAAAILELDIACRVYFKYGSENWASCLCSQLSSPPWGAKLLCKMATKSLFDPIKIAKEAAGCNIRDGLSKGGCE